MASVRPSSQWNRVDRGLVELVRLVLDDDWTVERASGTLHDRVGDPAVVVSALPGEVRFEAGAVPIHLEHELLKRWYGGEPRGVSAVFAQARAEAVDIALLTTRNLSVLGRLPLSSEAKTRIAQTLDGRPDLAVLVPTRMITVSGTT